jgi:uncharacterized protein
MLETVLIAGGTGLIGQELCEALLGKGYRIKLLGRTKRDLPHLKSYVWDPSKSSIDLEAFEGTDYVVNLAGANVGEGRWTGHRKKELIDSRIMSTKVLISAIQTNHFPIKKFIQASAIGYYGFSDLDIEFKETDEAGNDFLAELTNQWEAATKSLDEIHVKLILRIGVVLSDKGGALPTMSKPIKMFAGTSLGSGKQFVPWIHIEDLIEIFLKGIRDPTFKGIYNAVAPNPVTNHELTNLIGKALHKPIWPIPAPSLLLKLVLGEQAQIVLQGNKISNQKLLETGFKFKYDNAENALNQLIKKES